MAENLVINGVTYPDVESLNMKNTAGEMVQFFPGGAAAETLEYSQENPVVAAFISEVTYDPDDYTTSQIDTYAGQTTDYPKSKPLGVEVDLPAGTMLLADAYSGIAIEQSVAAGTNVFTNIIPSRKGADYVVVADGTVKQSGHLLPTGQVRMIQCTTSNVRDLGGWACDGGTVKYGKLFRGGEFQEADLDIFINQLGIRHELNLRGTAEAESEPTTLRNHVGYTCPEKYVWYTITGYNDTWKEIIRCVFDAVKSNDPVYFHCSAGADRTGTVACILEAILGMSQSDIDKDYELTCFASGVSTDNAARRRNESEWKGLINQINALTGSTFRDKVINWVASLGFTADEINAYRTAMIDGTPTAISLNIASYSVTNSIGAVETDNTATTVAQYQPYEAELTAPDGYAISNLKITMGGVDVTASVFKGYKTTLNRKVVKNLTNCSLDNSKLVVIDGQGYVANLTVADGFTFEGGSVKIEMGGVDVSAYYSEGKIAIPSVTGDIIITAEAVASAPEGVPIVWKNGYNATYTVGSACSVTANASYITTEEMAVEHGKTYYFDWNCPGASDAFRFIGVNASGIVTEAKSIQPGKAGVATVEWSPTVAETVGCRLRGYASAASSFLPITEMRVK